MKKIKLIIFSTLFFFIVFEIIGFFYFFTINKKITSPKNIYQTSEELNKYKSELENITKCAYKDILFPHSYLTFVHWNNPKCKDNHKKFNNFGFNGPDFPSTNEKGYFDILILGGSVAAQFGPSICDLKKLKKKDNYNFCIDFLGNELSNFRSIDDKPIRVFNGAIGSYRQPLQLIITHMFGHLFDLVISIEGYNEHNVFRKNEHQILDQPSGYFEIVNNSFLHNNFYESIIYSVNNFLRNLGIKYKFLIHSHTYNFLYNSLKKISYKTFNNNLKSKNYRKNHSYNYNDIKNIKDILHKNKFKKYKNYWKSMDHFTNLNNSNLMVFLQPSLITENKKLTENEKMYLKRVSDLELRKKIFLEFENIYNELSEENFNIYSMYNLFNGNSEELYVDYVHLNYEGNLIVAKYIVQKLVDNNFVKKNE